MERSSYLYNIFVATGTKRYNTDLPTARLLNPQSSVSIRNFATYQSSSQSGMHAVNGTSSHRAFIALGSNVGSRIEMIEKACLEMDRANIKVRRTSSLFETEPMYVLDQDPFINGVCEVSRPNINTCSCLITVSGGNQSRTLGAARYSPVHREGARKKETDRQRPSIH